MLSVAVAQTIPVKNNIDANVAEHLKLMSSAANAGAHTLVFPELSLTGYELTSARTLAFTTQDRRLLPIAAAAAAHAVTAIVGLPLRLDDGLFIAAAIIVPEEPPTFYTKHHLGAFPPEVNPGGAIPPAESTVFQAGNHNPLVRQHDLVGSLAICADTAHAQHIRDAAVRGANAYLAGMFFTPADAAAEHERLTQHAAAHSMLVAAANFGGPTGGLDAAGGSSIWAPDGTRLVQLPTHGAGVATATQTASGWRTSVNTLS